MIETQHLYGNGTVGWFTLDGKMLAQVDLLLTEDMMSNG